MNDPALRLSLCTRTFPQGFTVELSQAHSECLEFARRLVNKLAADGETVSRAALSLGWDFVWQWDGRS
ncbi:MAG TPA: hypothetical protein VK989_19785 [Polyangia bacterium]|jgi:hypothetical protein|nr:hypothetical protein [Polyangia bacterium]